MRMIAMIDPERITARIFGCPVFGNFYCDGIFVRSLDGTKLWLESDIALAWWESRNCPPVILGE